MLEVELASQHGRVTETSWLWKIYAVTVS